MQTQNHFLDFAEQVIARHNGFVSSFEPVSMVYLDEGEKEEQEVQPFSQNIVTNLYNIQNIKEENYLYQQNLSFLTQILEKRLYQNLYPSVEKQIEKAVREEIPETEERIIKLFSQQLYKLVERGGVEQFEIIKEHIFSDYSEKEKIITEKQKVLFRKLENIWNSNSYNNNSKVQQFNTIARQAIYPEKTVLIEKTDSKDNFIEKAMVLMKKQEQLLVPAKSHSVGNLGIVREQVKTPINATIHLEYNDESNLTENSYPQLNLLQQQVIQTQNIIKSKELEQPGESKQSKEVVKAKDIVEIENAQGTRETIKQTETLQTREATQVIDATKKLLDNQQTATITKTDDRQFSLLESRVEDIRRIKTENEKYVEKQIAMDYPAELLHYQIDSQTEQTQNNSQQSNQQQINQQQVSRQQINQQQVNQQQINQQQVNQQQINQQQVSRQQVNQQQINQQQVNQQQINQQQINQQQVSRQQVSQQQVNQQQINQQQVSRQQVNQQQINQQQINQQQINWQQIEQQQVNHLFEQSLSHSIRKFAEQRIRSSTLEDITQNSSFIRNIISNISTGNNINIKQQTIQLEYATANTDQIQQEFMQLIQSELVRLPEIPSVVRDKNISKQIEVAKNQIEVVNYSKKTAQKILLQMENMGMIPSNQMKSSTKMVAVRQLSQVILEYVNSGTISEDLQTTVSRILSNYQTENVRQINTLTFNKAIEPAAIVYRAEESIDINQEERTNRLEQKVEDVVRNIRTVEERTVINNEQIIQQQKTVVQEVLKNNPTIWSESEGASYIRKEVQQSMEDQINQSVNQIANKVYRRLEDKLRTERGRRGLV